MQAIVAADRAAGRRGLSLAEVRYPCAAEIDVIVRVHAAAFTAGELGWPAAWTDPADILQPIVAATCPLTEAPV